MERILLSNKTFEGHNNAYLFADGPETVLVDTGDRLPETREQLAAKLDDHDVSFADIDRVFLTHWHGDHRGLAGYIQQESAAQVYAHHADAGLVAGDETAWDQMVATQKASFERWGMPAEKRETLMSVLDSIAWREEPPSVETFSGGDEFEINGTTLRAVHAPGHTAGQCLFEMGEAVLTGDALLPRYTPNVGGADVRVDRPLATYLQTLRSIKGAEYERAYPGHRDAIDDPTARAQTIIDHHEHRAYRVMGVLSEHGPCDAWTVSDQLFGELEGIHILHGPGEAFAHLSHLEDEGLVARAETRYTLTDEGDSQLAAIENERLSLGV